MLTAVDLFCGSGGLSAGMIDSGIDIVSAYDNWPVSVDTYARNIGNHVHQFDLENVESSVQDLTQFDVDIFAGGPAMPRFLDSR